MSKNLVAAFRDLTDRKDVVFHGPGSFKIGLSTDGSVVVEPEDNAAAVCVVLLELNVSPSGGYVLSPANYDLPCVVNDSEELTREINLIDGTRLEVANKTMVFIDGPIPVRRRKLPRTPGMPLEDGAPAKPSRAQTPEKTPSEVTEQNHVGGSSVGSHQEANDDYDGDKDDSDNDDDGNDRRWLETSWCMLDMPTSEQQLFTDLKTPEQISIVAASYFCKQLRLFTDANVTTQLLDDIFKLFKDSITTGTCRDIFLDYLSQISKIIQKNPRRSQTRPMHRPAIKLLNGLIKQSVASQVILLLDLLRTFSHFDSNLITMARHQVAATVLGCISMYCDVVEVQCYGLDTLAKIAKFKPVIDVKAPLREGAVDIILKSETKHHKNLNICRSLCRVLANLSASLIDVTNTLLDTEAATNKAVVEAIDRYEECLLFMFKHSLPVVQTILDDHGTDLGVHTEGRRFVYFYAKLPQLQQKKKAWLQTLLEEEEVETIIEIIDEPDTSTPAIHDLLAYPESEQEPKGILKKAGSFENLREPGRRIVFADTTEGGSASDTSSSEDEMFDGSPFPENNIPTQIEAEDDFTFHFVKTLISNTLGSPKHNSFDSSDSSDDELLTTKIVKPKLKKPINRIAQKPDKNIDTQMLNNQLDSHKHETQTERKLIENSEELQFVENHYDRDSFSSDAHQRDILDDTDVLADCDQLDAQINTEKIVSSKNEENCNTGKTSALNENLAVNTYYRNGNCSHNGFQKMTVSSIPHVPKLYDASQSPDRTQHNDISVNYNNTMANGSEDKKVFVDQDVIASTNLIEVGHQAVCSEALIPENNEIRPNTSVKVSVLCDNKILSTGSVTDSQEPTKEPCDVAEPNKGYEAQRTDTALSNYSRTLDSSVLDVPFMGKLVRTQIITHVGSLVFQGDDSKVLMVIDEPIVELLEHATAPAGLVEFAKTQYGRNMTLMDLEPSIVISAIDAVRYRSVTAELVQKAVLSLTRAITHKLQPSTVNITMLFYKTLFSDKNVKTIVTEKTFVQEFKVCFSNATERLQTSHSIEEIRTTLSSPSFIV